MAGPGSRPVSPHLSIWRWHVTMASSILHRFSGIALYGAAVGVALWLIIIAMGPDKYDNVQVVLMSPLGQIALYLIVAALAFHLANGIRHLVFDTSAGLQPGDADTSAWFAILFAFAAPVGMWALLTFGS